MKQDQCYQGRGENTRIQSRRDTEEHRKTKGVDEEKLGATKSYKIVLSKFGIAKQIYAEISITTNGEEPKEKREETVRNTNPEMAVRIKKFIHFTCSGISDWSHIQDLYVHIGVFIILGPLNPLCLLFGGQLFPCLRRSSQVRRAPTWKIRAGVEHKGICGEWHIHMVR